MITSIRIYALWCLPYRRLVCTTSDRLEIWESNLSSTKTLSTLSIRDNLLPLFLQLFHEALVVLFVPRLAFHLTYLATKEHFLNANVTHFD